MATATEPTIKKTTRTRKTSVPADSSLAVKPDSLIKNLKGYEESFVNLLNVISSSKEEFSSLQREITDIKDLWIKERKDHETAVAEINQQEEIKRKRENETYDYDTALSRKKAEDEFEERKNKWEKELQARKEEIAEEKQELEMLRKQVAGFETEKEKMVKDASLELQKELTGQFTAERKLREQEVRSEQEILALKIANLTSENARLENEVAVLKKSLENATAQIKDVAVKVIESSSSKPQANFPQEP